MVAKSFPDARISGAPGGDGTAAGEMTGDAELIYKESRVTIVANQNTSKTF